MRHWHRLPSPALDWPKIGRQNPTPNLSIFTANVCNRHRKRYHPPPQTFATAIANVIIATALQPRDSRKFQKDVHL